jgi:transcriptional regulator with XRE-family HTH domain
MKPTTKRRKTEPMDSQDHIRKDIAALIKHERKIAGLTQEELAKRAEVKLKDVVLLESRKYDAPADTILFRKLLGSMGLDSTIKMRLHNKVFTKPQKANKPRAKRKRQYFGPRKYKLDQETIERARTLLTEGKYKIENICKRFNVSVSTLYRALRTKPHT